MRSDLHALAYLAWRQIVNTAREALKNPGRVVLWIFVALSVAASFGLRILAGSLAHRHGRSISPGLAEPWATAFFFGYVLLIASNVWIAASGSAAGFSSEADARFLTLSKIAPRRMLVWLQLRSSAMLMVQTGLVSLFYPAIFPQAGAPLPMFLTIVAAVLFVAAVRMPVFRARVRFGAAPFATFAALAGVAGVAGLAAVLAPYILPAFAPAGAYVEHLGFGQTVRSMLVGAPLPILIFWAFPLGALVLGSFGSTDVVPEIYAASLRAIATSKRNRRGLAGHLGGRADRYAAGPTRAIATRSRTSRAWNGAFALVWKDWLAFSRSRGAIGRSLAMLAGGLAAGAGIGLWTRQGHDPNIVAIQAVNLSIIFLSLYSSIALNADLGKPLWWLNADPLVARLGAWVVAATWRGAALGTSAVIGCALAIGSLTFALVGTLAAVGTVLYLRCIGLALYAMFPAQIDQKGPVAGLRILLAYLFIAPAGIVAGIAGGVASSFVVAGLAAAIVAAVECFFLVRFAAGKIRDNGVGVARAEAA